MSQRQRRDLMGCQFGRLTVIGRADRDAHGHARWLCQCECGSGKQTIVAAHALTRGTTRSCGCRRKESLLARATHRMRHSPEYYTFGNARARCRNPNNTGWKNYGGRGIRFLYTSFEEFFADVGPRPPGLTIDRIDNDGHYEPGNCRWATRREQANNSRANRRLTAFGRTQTMSQWAREYAVDCKTLFNRLALGWSVEDALGPPIAAQRVTAFGKTRTVSQWAKEVGITPGTLSSRLSRRWKPEVALTKLATPRQARLLTAFGKTKRVVEWAREYKIASLTLWERLQSGMNPEAALTMPPHGARLTPDLVRTIRADFRGGNKGALGRKYNVSEDIVRNVLKRRTWRHV